MKKNWIIILSAALLVCLLLTGCGGTKSSVSPTFAPPVPNQEPVAVPAPGNNNAPDAFLYTQTLGNGLVVGISSNGMSNYTLTLRGADVQDRLKDIPQLRDYLSNIKSLRLEQGVREVNEKAFKDWTGLTEIYIGDDVAVIGDYAFSGCTALTDVSIRSDRLETIGQYAFEGCTALKDGILVECVDHLVQVLLALGVNLDSGLGEAVIREDYASVADEAVRVQHSGECLCQNRFS